MSIINAEPDIYFTYKWAKLNEKIDNGYAEVFTYECSLGKVSYCFIKRSIPLKIDGKEYYDIITPFGYSGPFILECKNKENLDELTKKYNDSFAKYCNQNNIVSEFTKFSPWINNHSQFGQFYDLEHQKETLFVNLLVDDIFIDEFSSNCRNKIRKSIKNDVKIEFDFEGKTVDEFCILYRKMAEKNNISDYYRFHKCYIEEMFEKFHGNVFIINAIYSEQYISTAMFLHYSKYVHYFLAGNDPKYVSLGANSLILFEASKWGKINNKEQLHLGGAGTESLFKFKRQFTKNGICKKYVGKKIHNKTVYDELSKRKKIINDSFFPLYRG